MKMLCSRLLVLLMLSCLASGAVLVGVNDHFLWRGPADQNVAVSWVQTSNAQLLRSDVNWASLEPSKGNYSQHYVAVVDNVLANYTQLGVRVLLMLGTSPPWANGNQSIWAPPLDVTDFANFCEFVVRRWGAQIDSIEIWNEPSYQTFWVANNTENFAAGQAYAALVQSAGPRIRSVATSLGMKVSVGAPVIHSSYAAVNSQWLSGFYSVVNISQAYDVFCTHDYWSGVTGGWPPTHMAYFYNTSDPTHSIFGSFNSLVVPLMQANGDGSKPVWFTESGAASCSSSANYTNRFVSFQDQDALMKDLFAQIAAGVVPNLARVYWYDIFDAGTGCGTNSEDYYGLLAISSTTLSATNAVQNIKPAFATFQSHLAVVPSTSPAATASSSPLTTTSPSSSTATQTTSSSTTTTTTTTTAASTLSSSSQTTPSASTASISPSQTPTLTGTLTITPTSFSPTSSPQTSAANNTTTVSTTPTSAPRSHSDLWIVLLVIVAVVLLLALLGAGAYVLMKILKRPAPGPGARTDTMRLMSNTDDLYKSPYTLS